MILSQKHSLSMWESVAPILESLLAGRPIGTGRSLAESKCAANLRTLKANKAEFKNWNERLINALAQSLGTQWRPFMKNLNRALDTTRKVLDHEDLEDIDGHDKVSIDQGDSTDESIYGLLVDKTERGRIARELR